MKRVRSVLVRDVGLSKRDANQSLMLIGGLVCIPLLRPSVWPPRELAERFSNVMLREFVDLLPAKQVSL
jgi:hypothetical protein